MKKAFNKLFSTSAAGLYMVLFAVAIGAATFIENDFGTSSAQKVVYQSWWFELLLVLFSITILVNIRRYRMIQQKKWPLLTFHLAIIVILIGAGVTRYAGYEGMMHIREGSASNEILTTETFLKFEVEKDGQTYTFDEEVYFASLGRNRFNESYQLGNEVLDVDMIGFVPNPTKEIQETPLGIPILKVVIGGEQGRREYFLQQGDVGNLSGTVFNFGNFEQPQIINFRYQNDSLLVKAPAPLSQMQMATQRKDTLAAGVWHPLMLRTLYTAGASNFVIGDFSPNAKVVMKAADPKMKNESIAAVGLQVSSGSDTEEIYVYGNKGGEGMPVRAHVGDMHVSVSYGSRYLQLPFAIRLRDFIMERYPGTNSASSYASEVTLVDDRNNLEEDHRIFMNNILDYGGYRFFQSSFDQDELGTVLSVNHDFWGTWISYIGYALLTLGLLLTLVSRKSRFYDVSQRLKALRTSGRPVTAALIGCCLLAGAGTVHANSVNEYATLAINKAHASEFARVVVQDHKGRMKPMHTLCSEILRKLAREEKLHDQTPEQIMLGMMLYPEEWSKIPLIKVGKHEGIRQILNAGDAELLPFDAFFTQAGQYVLNDHVRSAYALEPADRTTLDKELMRIDERVNICNMIFSGSLMRIYPVGSENDTWFSPMDVRRFQNASALSPFVQNFFPAYIPTVQEAMVTGNWELPNDLVHELADYQHREGGHLVPSQSKIDLEILLNKTNIFDRLGKYYGLLGMGFLIVFFAGVFNHKFNIKWPLRIALGLLAVCFLMHTAGLGVRWYVSGRAPWSNGYESMIYIAWTTTLAGLIFARKSLGGLTATAILASTILMVAHLSYLDPEITPLVPVLRSYWLTIHVSLIAGSYGFLMLGAIIGVLNLLLISFLSERTKPRVMRTVKELSWISEMTLTGGLIMLSIGTYLGGIWANESWGRYWGWDAKETWALVTILVYAFILHMRFIPGFRGVYALNVASLFGFASVIMTYFGVNYYLSGLHSYAAGDPVPVPTAVYITAGSLLVLSLLALWRWKAVSR